MTRKVTFSTDAYCEALQALANARSVRVRVAGWRHEQLHEKLKECAVAELVIDSYPIKNVAAYRGIEGDLEAGLIVMQRSDRESTEGSTFELACELAIALGEWTEPGAEPIMPYGQIYVSSIEPEPLDEVLGQRVTAYRVSYTQLLIVRALDIEVESQPIKRIWLGRAPNIGPGHEDDYTLLAGDPP